MSTLSDHTIAKIAARGLEPDNGLAVICPHRRQNALVRREAAALATTARMRQAIETLSCDTVERIRRRARDPEDSLREYEKWMPDPSRTELRRLEGAFGDPDLCPPEGPAGTIPKCVVAVALSTACGMAGGAATVDRRYGGAAGW